MAIGSDPNLSEPGSSLPRRGWRRWRKPLALAGGSLVLGTTLLGGWGYILLRRNLPQFLQDNLSTALNRPLKVGEFQRFGPTGVRLGPSILPPTEDNFSWVKAQALEVNFNPLDLLLTRTLRPSLVFVEPQMAIKQGFDGEWRVEAPQSIGERGVVKTELRSIQVRNANLAIGPISRTSIVELPEGVTSATLILLENVNLRVRFSGADNQTAALVVGGRLNNGAFQLRGEAQLDTRQANLAVQSQLIPIEAVNPLFGGNFFIRNGLLSTNLDLKIRPGANHPLTATGTARLRNGDLVITDLPSPLQDINGTFVANGVGGRFEHSSLKFGPILVKAEGSLDLDQGHHLRVTIPGVSVQEVETALARSIPLDTEGRFQINTHITGALLSPRVTGRLDSLGPARVDRLGLDSIEAQFAANLESFTLNQATLRPATGGTLTAQGTVGWSGENWRQPEINLTAQTDLPLDNLAQLYQVPLPSTLQLGALQAQAEINGKPEDLKALADWQLPQATFPGQGRVVYGDRQLQAQNSRFQIGAGTLRADAIARLDNLNWQATVAGSTLALGLLSPHLRGALDTDLRASGNLSTLTPQGIRVDGRLRLSQALPLNRPGVEDLLPGPLTASFAWGGKRLEIEEAIASHLSARGSCEVTFPGAGGWPDIAAMDFAARLSGVDLAAAYGLFNGPTWLQPQGLVDFDGTLRGRWRDPSLAGRARLRQVALNNRTLFNEVAGPIRASLSQGAEIDLRGNGEEITAAIDPSGRPHTFRVANGLFVAVGQRRGQILDAELRNLAVGDLALRPLANAELGLDWGEIQGLLNATAQVDLTDLFDPHLTAEFDLAQPGVGAITADRLTGHLGYRQGQALLTNGMLQLSPTTQLAMTGQGQLFPHWQVKAEITTDQADFQDLLQTLNLYNYADFRTVLNPRPLGRAADLAVTPVGRPQAPLLEQGDLARMWRDRGTAIATQRANTLLPSLDQLEGQVSGTVGVAASRREGLTADFHLAGQNWAWGRYDFDNQFLAKGQLRNQTLSLDPVEFRAGATRLSLLGTLDRQASDLAVRAENLPLAAAANLLETPFAVTGQLNLNAHLTGAYPTPQLAGDLAIDQASVNQQPLQEISSSFQYQEAYLSLAGRVVGTDPEPLLFSGTVPYALPFMAVQPTSNQLALRATLQNDALSLINLLTPWLNWGGGDANIDLRVGGTLNQPLISGVAAFDGATFTSPVLAASLDNLTGAVNFLGNQLQVDTLTGTLFDGDFELTGNLPLTVQAASKTDQGLQLTLGDINVNVVNEIRSRVNGSLTITQALFAPVIGGTVLLQEAQVTVGPELIRIANAILNPTPQVAQAVQVIQRLQAQAPIQFDHLRLVLRPARAKAPPLFSFLLEGDVAVSGPLSAPYAEGGLRLLDGWLHTVTAEFFLETGRDNWVLFSQNAGLDPYLDVILSAQVPLQRNYNINRLNSSTGAAEIPDINRLGSNTTFDELLIEARLKGYASRLFDNLTLTSNPSYSQAQLLGMVSGGYLADLGGAEPALALGSNLLSALSADTQDSVGQALGLRRFRLTASTVLPSEAGDALGYGLGANLSITHNLSATLVQVLNQNQPIQLNARYRIDENWGVRGSTNFGDDSRMMVEYRLNF